MSKVARIAPDETDLAYAVSASLDAVTLTPADAGAAKLALDYATAITSASDRGDALDRLGPKLLAALDALGATPAARARVTKAATGHSSVSQLGKLRDARRRKT